jgi:2-phosphosulfolactate phosphatase
MPTRTFTAVTLLGSIGYRQCAERDRAQRHGGSRLPDVLARPEHRQIGYDVRLEWGREGAALLAAECAVVIVVDVLSFSTAVDVAVGRGAAVLPLRSAEPDRPVPPDVLRAGPRRGPGPSLSPASLTGLSAGTRLALPSPNGATLCAAVATGGAVLFAGCLRNASAVAAAARAVGGPVGIVPAGERWPDDTMRVAAEDALGAGAIAAALPGRSPEAELAAAQFAAARDRGLGEVLAATSSGRELHADGFVADVDLAAALDASTAVPRLRDGFLRAA